MEHGIASASAAAWVRARVAWAVTLGVAASLAGRAADLGDLRRELAAALGASRAPGAGFGVSVVRVADGMEVFSTNAHRLFVPASNTKLFTVACALDRFGPEWRWETRLLSASRPSADGVLAGDLVVVGCGDPGFGGRSSEPPAVAFGRLIDALRMEGVRRVDGDLVVAEGWFDAGPYGSGWGWDDIPEGYGAPVSAAVAYRNAAWVRVVPAGVAGGRPSVGILPWNGPFEVVVEAVTGPAQGRSRIRLGRLPGSGRMRVGGSIALGDEPHQERMAVPDGASWFAGCLRAGLEEAGIPVSGRVRVVDSAPGLPRLAGVPSEPMGELAAQCLKPSDNLLAQLLLLQLGRDVRTRPRADDPADVSGDDESRGVGTVSGFLGRIGVPAGAFVMEEGSGLSRKNLATPDATVRLLRHMAAHPAAAAWRAALPVAGTDGTLSSRLQGERTRGAVRAKTGTLRHVNALSGYLTTSGGEDLAFAILLNGYVPVDQEGSGRAEIDRLVGILASWDGRAAGSGAGPAQDGF